MVAVAVQRVRGEPLAKQVEQEGLEEFDDTLSWGDIVRVKVPALGPCSRSGQYWAKSVGDAVGIIAP